ncbi:MAG: hypothetical protein HC834_10690, partial [Rhodospirillales bacterium]|nr:hypothetical protein [Rhodospirillales bacterium]
MAVGPVDGPPLPAACVESVRAEARGKGVPEAVLERAFRGLLSDASVVGFLQNQPEFRTPAWDYLAALVDDEKTRFDFSHKKALSQDELERIAATLGWLLWPEDEKLDARFGQEAVAEVCTQWDPDDISGCSVDFEGEPAIAAVEVGYTASHELAHAVRRYHRTWSTTAFEEGLAELLSGSDGFPVYVSYPRGGPAIGPLALLEIPREDFHVGYYVASQNFLSWLWEAEGQEKLLAYVDDPAFDGVEAAIPLFEQHYGYTLAEAEQAYRVDERPDPIWGAPCIPERTYSLAEGPVELSGDFDCGASNVFGASYLMSLWPMCLEVPRTTRVRLSYEADHGRFQVLRREPCTTGPAGAEAYGDKYVEAGEVVEEDIVGCRFRMLLTSQEPGFPATPYSIRIEEID